MPIYKKVNNVVDEAVVEDKHVDIPVMESETPLTDIISQISGYKWIVTYFNLVTDHEFNATDFDTFLTSTTIEYNIIKDLVIRVEDPIRTDLIQNIEGSGYIDGDIIPRRGDVFTSRLLDGRIGIFYLTGVERRTYNTNRIYRITYKLYKIIDDLNDQTYLNLLSRTIAEYIYNEVVVKETDKTLLSKDEYLDRNTIEQHIELLLEVYNEHVITSDVKYTISYLDDIDRKIYEPYLEDFIVNIIPVTRLNSRLNTYNLKERDIITIWDVILDNKKLPLLKYIYSNIVSTADYGTNPFFRKPYVSNIDFRIGLFDIPTDETKPYLFTEDFYNVLLNQQDIVLNSLETLVLDIIRDNPIDINVIHELYEAVISSNDRLVRFYHIPIVIYGYKYYLSKKSIVYI